MKKKEFKRGDYIILIDYADFGKGPQESNKSIYFPLNRIYKIKTTSEFFLPEVDGTGLKNNGWTGYKACNLSNWRYATDYEIEIYNNAKKKPPSIFINSEKYSII